jgi:hypothetical protein
VVDEWAKHNAEKDKCLTKKASTDNKQCNFKGEPKDSIQQSESRIPSGGEKREDEVMERILYIDIP